MEALAFYFISFHFRLKWNAAAQCSAHLLKSVPLKKPFTGVQFRLLTKPFHCIDVDLILGVLESVWWLYQNVNEHQKGPCFSLFVTHFSISWGVSREDYQQTYEGWGVRRWRTHPERPKWVHFLCSHPQPCTPDGTFPKSSGFISRIHLFMESLWKRGANLGDWTNLLSITIKLISYC